MTHADDARRPDLTRLKELILYVSEASKDDEKFGAVKLNKILYWADFEAHRRFGKSITGAEYQHLSEGPAPRQLLPARRQLVEEAALELEERPCYTYVREIPVVKRMPDLSAFSPPEIELVDKVIQMLRDYNASQVSELSHREWGWRLTTEGETIHYRTAWLSPAPLTQAQIERAQEIAATR